MKVELIKQEGITAEELTAIIGIAPSSIRKNVNLAQQNTNILMKLVKKEHGLVKAVHLV